MARRTDRGPALTSQQQDAVQAKRIEAAETQRGAYVGALSDAHDLEAAKIRKLQSELGIAHFDTHKEAGPLLMVQRALTAGLAKISAELDLIGLQAFLERHPGSNPEKQAENQAKVKELRTKAALPIDDKPAPPQPGALPAEVEKALAAIEGGGDEYKPAPRRDVRRAELEDKRIHVETGIWTVLRLIEDLRNTLADEQQRRLRPAHGKLLVEIFRTCQQLAETAARERRFRSALVSAGFTARSDLLPAPAVLSAILLLGAETDWSSQISEFRRFLESRKLL
jgi:hypothetical protein